MIDEYVGSRKTQTAAVKHRAHARARPMEEPVQTPEFDEYYSSCCGDR